MIQIPMNTGKNMNSFNSNMYLSQKYDENYYNNNNVNYQTTNQPFQQVELQQQPKNNYYHQDSNNIAHISSETYHYTSLIHYQPKIKIIQIQI